MPKWHAKIKSLFSNDYHWIATQKVKVFQHNTNWLLYKNEFFQLIKWQQIMNRVTCVHLNMEKHHQHMLSATKLYSIFLTTNWSSNGRDKYIYIHWKKKLSRFDLKSWVVLTWKVESFWPEKLSHFDLKSCHFDLKSWVILTSKF